MHLITKKWFGTFLNICICNIIMSKLMRKMSNPLHNTDHLSSISSTLKQASFTARLQFILKILFYLSIVFVSIIIYMVLFHKSRVRWFAPSIMIDINKYNLEFSTKVTSLILNYNKLLENQFPWTSRLKYDIYENVLNDDVAEVFKNIRNTLEDEKKFKLDSNDIYMSAKISKFLNKKFEQYKKYKNIDIEYVNTVFNDIEQLVNMKQAFESYVDQKYIMDFLDTSNLHHTKLVDNKLFNKYLIFMSETLKERYLRIKVFHPTSTISEYLDELVNDKEHEWFFNSKNNDILTYCKNIFKDIQDTIKYILTEHTTLTMDELNNIKKDRTQNMNMVDADEHNSLLRKSLDVLSTGMTYISNDDYDSLKSVYHISLEKYLYQTFVKKNNIHTNVFSEFDANTILSKFRNILDILMLNKYRLTIENAMDFTLHYILDADNSKIEKLNIYNQFYLQLFEYIAYHENNYERLIRYNRSRWPILPELQKSYTKQFGTAFRILIKENIADEWSKFGKSNTKVTPILNAIENLINPKVLLQSLL